MKCGLRKKVGQKKRATRVRKRIKASGRPRLSVSQTNRHLYAQLIDDEAGKTIVGLATYSKQLAGTEFNRVGVKAAKEMGQRIAKLAKEKGVEKVVLDRGHRSYGGILAALSDGAREAGLQF